MTQYTANYMYLGYLYLLKSMPKGALQSYEDVSISWVNFQTTVGLNLPKKEYERLMNIEFEKTQAIVGEVGYLTTEQVLQLEREERRLRELSAASEVMNGQEMEERLKSIVEKAADVGAAQQRLQDTARQMDDFYREAFEKYALLPDDDQYLMWGKIVRLATMMESSLKSRELAKIQSEQDKSEAIAQGIDVSDWYEVQYEVTTHDILYEVQQGLDAYASYFPETKGYVPAVKQFYALVENNQYPLGGMVIMGTKDDLPHPVLAVGDIVLARNGTNVNNTAEYNGAKALSGDDILRFLRLDGNGQLSLYEEIVPPTEVLTGFLVLRESAE
jgi:hypothetical protein